MTKQQHPITPPPELFKQWEDDILNGRDNVDHVLDCAWRNGFQAGADQELEACLAEIRDGAGRIYIDETRLRVLLAEDIWTARRPKPPSLKEQAFQALCRFQAAEGHEGCTEEEIVDDFNTISRALEALPE